MSKADIENVTALAAHLSLTWATRHYFQRPKFMSASTAAQDAMKLQRLGRRATRNAERYCNITDYEPRYNQECTRILKAAAEILDTYDLVPKLSGDPRGYCLKIKGLPGNTWGGDEAGFGIG